MKTLDVLAAALLVVGGLNWALYGLFQLDLVAASAGSGAALAQIAYGMIGLAALYQVLALRSIQRRWGVVTVRRK